MKKFQINQALRAKLLMLVSAVTLGAIASNALAAEVCGPYIRTDVEDGYWCQSGSANCMNGAIGTGHAYLYHYKITKKVHTNGLVVTCEFATKPSGDCCTFTGSKPSCPTSTCVVETSPVAPVILD